MTPAWLVKAGATRAGVVVVVVVVVVMVVVVVVVDRGGTVVVVGGADVDVVAGTVVVTSAVVVEPACAVAELQSLAVSVGSDGTYPPEVRTCIAPDPSLATQME